MPGSKTNLLIVDDEPSTRMSLTHVFAGLGHSVRSAEDGFSALSEIRKEVPDIILSDLNMPGMSGFELLSVVRRRFPAIQVIAMSGAFSGDSVQPGVAADAFYEKGTSFSFLLGAVQTMTGEPSLLRDRQPPIWIARNGHDASGGANVMISCPECLRSFSLVLGETVAVIRQVECCYCRVPIHYAIVQATNPASPQAFQRKPTTATPASPAC